MENSSLFCSLGIIAAIAMPLFNIPLIIKIIKRKSSRDISLLWVLGIWLTSLLMLPSGLLSHDIVLKLFNVTNFVLFTFVFAVAYRYRNGCPVK